MSITPSNDGPLGSLSGLITDGSILTDLLTGFKASGSPLINICLDTLARLNLNIPASKLAEGLILQDFLFVNAIDTIYTLTGRESLGTAMRNYVEGLEQSASKQALLNAGESPNNATSRSIAFGNLLSLGNSLVLGKIEEAIKPLQGLFLSPDHPVGSPGGMNSPQSASVPAVRFDR